MAGIDVPDTFLAPDGKRLERRAVEHGMNGALARHSDIVA
jgi:hypothetical protein